MSALALGLIAAVAWGFHDICIRYLSQRTPLMASLFTVMIVGLIYHLGLMTIEGGFHSFNWPAMGYAALSGVLFLVASLGLYGAFQRGPVRLVSPIIASFPLLSVLWAFANGATITLPQWLAVFAIMAGVGIVAALADKSDDEIPPMGKTIFYSAISAFGFASTFAISQLAAEMSDHLPATLITRVTALICLVAIIAVMRLPFWPGKGALFLLSMMGIADGIALSSIVSAAGLPNAQHAAVASSIFGLLTIIMAWAFLKERVGPVQWAGCGVTFAGIAYLALSQAA